MTRGVRSLLAASFGLLLVSIVHDGLPGIVPRTARAADSPADTAAADPSADVTGRLTLRNGDHLQGQFAPSADTQVIAWRSTIFGEPLLLDRQGVESIDFGDDAASVAKPAGPSTATVNPVAGLVRILQAIPDSAKQATEPAVGPVPAVRPRGARIAARGDNVLYGTITGLDRESIRFTSDRHGEVTLRREAILEIEGLSERSSLLFDGSALLQGWKSLGGEGRSTGEWQRLGNGLRTEKKGANLYHETDQVEPWLLEVTMSGEGKPPEFQVALGVGPQLNELPHAVCIDNWGDRLVAYREGDGEIELVQLESPAPPEGDEEEKNRVHLRIYFAPEQREVTVYAGEKRLGQLQLAANEQPWGKGFLIRNRGNALRIEQARLRRWNGRIEEASTQPAADLVQLVDGRILRGRLLEYSPASGKLSIEPLASDAAADAKAEEVEWAQVDRLAFASASAEGSTNAPADASADASVNMQVDYLDGELLTARYAGANAEGLLLEMPQARGPVLSRWAGMRRVRNLEQPVADASGADKAFSDAPALVQSPTHRLHGRIVNSSSVDQLLWQGAFTRRPVRFVGALGAHVSFEPGPSPVDTDRSWGDLTLVSGETVPCQIGIMDEASLGVTFPGGHAASIPREQLRAVRLYSPRTWVYSGFRESDQWYASTREAGTIEWQPERLAFYKPALLAREIPEKTRLAIQFDLQFHGTFNSNVVVGIGADEPRHALRRPNDHVASEEAMREAAKERPDYVVEVIMTRHRNSLTARGVNKASGVLGMMFEANPFAAEERISPLALGENYAVHVEIRIDPVAREYAIFGNGQEMHRWRDTSPLEGKFLYFGATGEQDSVSRPTQSGNPQDAGRPLATFHNFRIQRWSGDMRSDDRERFLTRRVGASPKAVTHVLRAWNGDSLRGRLVGMTAEHVEFQSRLDTLTIPREKVAEIIQLPPPAPDSTGNASATNDSPAKPAEAAAADSGRIVLRRGGSLILRKIRATDQLLQGECSVAPISIPWAEIAEIYFASTTVPQPPYSDWALRNPPPLPELPPSAGPQEPSPLLGKAAPEVQFEMLAGPPTALKDLRGRVVILDFWATWCGPCLASMPALMEIAQEESLKDKVTLIAVNQQEEPAVLREFLASQLWKLNVALDRDGEFGKMFGAGAIPHTVLIDREGVIRHVHVGATPDLKQELMGKIETLLADPEPVAP